MTPSQTTYDYVIIGSGFGGSVSAHRLSEKGYKVLVIEKGKWFKPEDFPKSNWQLRKWLWLPSLKMFGLFKMTIFRHVTIFSGVGVGGGSLVYANTLPVPKRPFFKSPSWATCFRTSPTLLVPLGQCGAVVPRLVVVSAVSAFPSGVEVWAAAREALLLVAVFRQVEDSRTHGVSPFAAASIVSAISQASAHRSFRVMLAC